MSEEKIYSVPSERAAHTHINHEQYMEMYDRSINDPEGFWGEQAEKFIDWFRHWDHVLDWNFNTAHIRWFEGAKLNASYNCLDRHLKTRGDQVAIIWEGDNPEEVRKITYRELYEEVCRFANGLKSIGVKKGDRVCLYLPMIPEAAVAMFACARIGAVHSVVFGGFSPASLCDRINDSGCSILITCDQSFRGTKRIPLKSNADEAVKGAPGIRQVIVVKRGGDPVNWVEGRDVWYHDIIAGVSDYDCPPEELDAEHPLFILYTSGSTGKPKGALHTTGGYLLYAAMTHKYIFDYHDKEVFWCTADIGWVTGHTYILYGPLANGATTLMYEGVPTYPDPSRLWQVVDKHQVNIVYTAPTVIRSLMGKGDQFVRNTSRKSLRLLGSVGEPINPEVWEWYYDVVGEGRCPVVDTWWQTETGGILISPLPGAVALKPGAAALPFFGVEPALLDDKGNELSGVASGYLAMKRPWPGIMRTVYNNQQRFFDTYFKVYKGYYLTGDGARRDKDGYYWITGRVDDVINVSGHRLGSAEIESALVEHQAVAEAAVVGFPHKLKGQGIYAYVTLMSGIQPGDELRKELVTHVRKAVGPIATPDVIQWVSRLPKTRSGKIMRRILRKVANNELESLGDTSTLADPSVVDHIIKNRAIL